MEAAERIVAAARLRELHECSALLRRTRVRAEQIVDEARMMLAEAEREGEPGRILTLSAQLDEARAAYRKVINAYVALCRRIDTERRELA
ncbi:hypothetical protein GCM10009560_64330 [Nonomuraea longicatena]|uniref:Uncharacterized protein n=1 Tax=Nonomuraea longicatena TaxID=83682 RepID=A0ABP4BEQ8_9ACTN